VVYFAIDLVGLHERFGSAWRVAADDRSAATRYAYLVGVVLISTTYRLQHSFDICPIFSFTSFVSRSSSSCWFYTLCSSVEDEAYPLHLKHISLFSPLTCGVTRLFALVLPLQAGLYLPQLSGLVSLGYKILHCLVLCVITSLTPYYLRLLLFVMEHYLLCTIIQKACLCCVFRTCITGENFLYRRLRLYTFAKRNVCVSAADLVLRDRGSGLRHA